MDTDAFNILAFCAGGGGLERGIGLALPQARTVVVVEREAFACEVLATAAQADGMAPFAAWTDARTFDGRPWRGVVDCFAGGIPCQPWSVAGKRRGTSDERDLWPDARRVIGEAGPPWVFIENVPGMLARPEGAWRIKTDLETMGYWVEAGLFSAAEVGASHRRERLFILAYNKCAARRSPAQGREPIAGSTKPGTERTGAPLADAPGAEGRGDGPERGQEGRAAPGWPGETVADASGKGHEERPGKRREDGQKRAASERSGLPLFPPGPGDLEAWRRTLEAEPTLEPAVCRVADGLAPRTDRLRLLGNGSVELETAYAWTILLARLWARLVERA